MKVAIIGGGLAGIVCATQLERYGIIPHLFERNEKIAETECIYPTFRAQLCIANSCYSLNIFITLILSKASLSLSRPTVTAILM